MHLCRGQFWSSVYYLITVDQYSNEESIQKRISSHRDVKNWYKKIYRNQLSFVFN
jgi:hypothetical protein